MTLPFAVVLEVVTGVLVVEVREGREDLVELGAVRPPLRGVDEEQDAPQQCLVDPRHGTVQDIVQHHAHTTALHEHAGVEDGWRGKYVLDEKMIHISIRWLY